MRPLRSRVLGGRPNGSDPDRIRWFRRTIAPALAGVLSISVSVAPSQPVAAAELGSWGAVLDWGVQAKHMAVLPTGNVLVWSTGLDARIWDSSSVADFTPVPFPAGDLHCAGQASLADGRLVVIGGQHVDTHEGIHVTALFDPTTGTWTEGQDMNWGRWYATATALPDGRLLATSGDDIHTDRVTIPEIYDPVADTWTLLPGADRRQQLYPYMFVIPGGRIVEAGPSTKSYFLDLDNGGSWTAGPTNSFGSSGYAESAVQYEPGKILRAGGGDPAFANAAVIDFNVANPQWRDIAPMHHARRRHDLTLMADGSVLAVGGTGRADSESDAVLIPEVWDPETEVWTELPAMAEARMYHSSTVLLPDGRVVVAGGEAAGRKRAQVFSPPYLQQGPRPTITSAPTVAAWASTISISTPDAADISKVALLRAAGSTHTFDHNQRYVPLDFTAQTGSLTVQTPVDGWTAPPGDYMLVIENSAGVPSVAEWVRIGSAGDLLPGEVTGVVTGATSGLPIGGATVAHGTTSVTTDGNGRFTMSDLPAGERSLTVSAPGFANQTRNASVAAGGVTTLDFALLAPSTVTGTVTDTGGSPVVGALVEVAGRSITTGSNGEYSLEIESGAHQVRISAITYLAATMPVSAPANGSVVLDVVLTDAPTILEGEVLDASTDEPILGATVSFAGGTTTTDDNGFYKFVDVEPDTYTVTASAPGYLSLTDPVLVDKGLAATLDFGLTPIPPPTTTHHPVADARVKSTSASRNYGTDSYLRTRYDAPGSTNYRSFLRFDVGQLAGPVVSARLRLFADDGSNDGGSVYPVVWTGAENAIDWNTAPPLTGSPIADFGAVDDNTWAEVDVTAAVSSGGVISFGLESRSTNSAFYSSREGANPPQLVIETTATVATQITSILPATGAVGDSVTLFGGQLANVTDVAFGGVPAAITSQSDDRVVTTVPLGATTGPITVDGPDGAASSEVFTVLVAPEISGFEPASGPPATPVTITGTGFATTQAVSFGATPAPFSIVSDTEISATVPAGAIDGVISVTNQVGATSSSSAFVVTDPPPVDSFEPSAGVVGTVVTIRGSGFSTVSDVSFGGAPAAFSIVSDTELTADVPAGASTGPITVTNATGATTTDPFTVIVTPTITDFDPRSGVAGDTQIDVTITGTSLSTVTEVRFNGTPAIGLSIDSDTQIRVEVPVGASTGPISVTNPAGTADTGTDHYVVSSPPPNLTFTPTDDARVREENDKNYGSSDYLRARAGDWESYIRFDVSGLPNPPASAKLRLWVTDGTSGGVDVYSADAGWTESDITGTTAPGPSGSPIASIGPIAAGAWLEIDVSAAVTGSGSVGFLLRGQNSNSLYMDSKEGLKPPELVVETAPVVGPFITSFSPGSGEVGTPVDIFGSNLTTVTQLRFGDGVIHGHQLTGGAIINGTHIRVPVPAGATTGPIVAVGQDGTFTTATDFVITTPPPPPPPDTTAPTVVATVPGDGVTGVSISTDLAATFSERVLGVDAQSFTLSDGVANVPAVVTYDDSTRTARLDPVEALAPDHTFVVSLTSAITDRATSPNALTAVSWSFTTGSQPSTSTTEFDVVADAKIKSSSATRNYGSETTLRNRSGSPEWRTLLKFDVQGLSGTVTEAKVRLFVNDGSNAAGSISAVSTGWTEHSVTWSDAPSPSGLPLDSVGAVDVGVWVEWDVTAAIIGNGSVAFALVSDSTNSILFDSRENPSGNVPHLVVTTDG